MTSTKSVVGLAIEDNVDLWLYRDNKAVFVGSKTIADGGNYFEKVRKLIQQLLEEMAKVEGGNDPGDLFNSIASFVISTPGVVESNKTLIQLPLWHSHQSHLVEWSHGDQLKMGFDFGEEIASIIEAILKKKRKSWRTTERKRFLDAVFVVNDATSCAAFEYSKRRGNPEAADFVFVKVHNGINVGVVEKDVDGKVTVKHVHAEAGHSFPSVHKYDAQAGFKGVCQYHGWCFEGMIATRGLFERALDAKIGAFSKWGNVVTSLRDEGLDGQDLESELANVLLGGRLEGVPGIAEAVDLMSHYIGQLVFQVLLGPSAPQHIVLGGRMAKKKLVEAVQEKVVLWANGYPKRAAFTASKVKEYIAASQATSEEKDTMDVRGAMVIARSRADIRLSSSITLLR